MSITWTSIPPGTFLERELSELYTDSEGCRSPFRTTTVKLIGLSSEYRSTSLRSADRHPSECANCRHVLMKASAMKCGASSPSGAARRRWNSSIAQEASRLTLKISAVQRYGVARPINGQRSGASTLLHFGHAPRMSKGTLSNPGTLPTPCRIESYPMIKSRLDLSNPEPRWKSIVQVSCSSKVERGNPPLYLEN